MCFSLLHCTECSDKQRNQNERVKEEKRGILLIKTVTNNIPSETHSSFSTFFPFIEPILLSWSAQKNTYMLVFVSKFERPIPKKNQKACLCVLGPFLFFFLFFFAPPFLVSCDFPFFCRLSMILLKSKRREKAQKVSVEQSVPHCTTQKFLIYIFKKVLLCLCPTTNKPNHKNKKT